MTDTPAGISGYLVMSYTPTLETVLKKLEGPRRSRGPLFAADEMRVVMSHLRAVEEGWHEIRENWCKDVLLKEEAQAEARRLKEYVRHKDLCAVVGGYGYGCTCGLTPPPAGPQTCRTCGQVPKGTSHAAGCPVADRHAGPGGA